MSPEQLGQAKLIQQPVRAVKLESRVCEGGSILFSPANLPRAQEL